MEPSITNAEMRFLEKSLVHCPFQPKFFVSNRAEVTGWLKRVFNRDSMKQSVLMHDERMGFPEESRDVDFASFTLIAEVLFDSVELGLFPGRKAISRNRLAENGWIVKDFREVFAACKRHGVRLLSSGAGGSGVEIDLDSEPEQFYGDDILVFYADERDVGIATELCWLSPEKRQVFGELCYPAVLPGYTVPPVRADDPLGIERCSHYTILTDDVSRALRFNVDIMGGRAFNTSVNGLLGTESSFVALGGSVIEFARPQNASSPAVAWLNDKRLSYSDRPQEDVFHAITFKVRDLDKAMAHLKACGVRFECADDKTVITDPADCLGMRWGFTSALPEHDARAE